MTRPHVLVVGKDATARARLDELISQEGGRATGAADESEALRILGRDAVDVVLVVDSLPLDAGTMIERCAGLPRRPVVCLLGSEGPSSEILERCLATLRKPQPRPGGAADIPLVVQRFVETIREANGLPAIRVDPEVLASLAGQEWADDLGDLRDAIEHAVIVSTDGRLRLEHLPEAYRVANPGVASRQERSPQLAGSSGTPFREAKSYVIERFERDYLGGLMRRHEGNVTAAARTAGMLRSALQRLLRKHRLRSSEFRLAGRAGSKRRERGRAGSSPEVG